ncbi:MAG: glycosyltransferase family 2 protein [Deltaproteobacteria bacterium]|nr:glycosyltransferase family 2 protein [Deltaproteobacteria bacterium]
MVSIIIPAYNEENTIADIVGHIKRRYPEYEIIVVNDGSTDKTADVASTAGAVIVNHPYNIGNGAAIKSGIRHACGDILVFMDGDGQHDPDDIERMLEHLPEYDMVVGARKLGGQTSIIRAAGNKIYNWLASYVAKFKILDLTSGFRAVKSEIARQVLYLLPNTYSYPTTMTLSLLRSGRSLKYLPIDVGNRQGGKSNIGLLRDGVHFFIIIVKICTLFSPFRVFLPVSFFLFVAGILYYLYTYFSWGRLTNMSTLLFSTSIIVFMMGLVSEQICQVHNKESEKIEC